MIKIEDGEKIIFEGRKHWFIPFTYAFSFFISAALIPVILLFAKNWFLDSNVINITYNLRLFYLLLFFCFIWILFAWVFLFISLTNYYLDVWYVTNKRLVDIDQKGLFVRDEAVLRLENIQDVAIISKGIIQTLLNFGNIRAQTSGEKREFIMKNIANPEKMKEIIVAQQSKIKERAVSVRVVE